MRALLVHLSEPVKNQSPFILWNANSAVTHEKLDMPVTVQGIAKGNMPPLGKLDGIPDQIIEDLPQPEIIRNQGKFT